METTIGVFASRDHAEKAVKELWERGVPKESIAFLTTSENEAKNIAKEFGAYVGGFVGGATGMTTAVVAASLLLPGVGPPHCSGLRARVRAPRSPRIQQTTRTHRSRPQMKRALRTSHSSGRYSKRGVH